MMHRSGRSSVLLVLLLTLAVLPGCVERQMIITSEPFGAVVLDERNLPLSGTPADKSFTYYGKYRFTLIKDGYETLVVEEDVRAPWYDLFLVDFISENLIPFTFRDIRRFHYKLQPAVIVPPEQVLEQGKPLRARGQTIGEPLPPTTLRPGAGVDQQQGAVVNPGPPINPNQKTTP